MRIKISLNKMRTCLTFFTYSHPIQLVFDLYAQENEKLEEIFDFIFDNSIVKFYSRIENFASPGSH